jgi:hypothetical protein
MTPGGWILMLLSVGFVTFLLVWCVYQVLKNPNTEETIHSQANIETYDDDT